MIKNDRTKLFIFIRWVFFIPLALVGSQVVYSLVRFGIVTSYYFLDIDPYHFFAHLSFVITANLICGASFLYLCIKIAPRYKKNVSYIVAIIYIMFCFLGYIYSLVFHYPWDHSIGLILNIIGTGFIAIAIHRNDIKI